jgi:transcriptional regulator GlxA family with amidase domain
MLPSDSLAQRRIGVSPVSAVALQLASLQRIGFWTLPNYSMIALSNALEGCRMANYVMEREVYTWRVLTLDGASVPASNGLSLTPTHRVADAGPLDIVFVCGGLDVRHVVDAGIKHALRRLARQGVPLGALCTGTFALAESDLLDGYRCAIHWENLAAIREEFPKVDFAEDLFVIDRDRFTCTGGVAPLDMMLTLIDARLGSEVANKVSDEFIVERMRPAGQPQSGPMRSAARSGNPVLAEAAQLMERTIENPIGVSKVARQVGVSARQLERLFDRYLHAGPAAFYLSLRVNRARELLHLTTMSVTEVAVACGFRSAAHFSTCYRRTFGRPPRQDRLSETVSRASRISAPAGTA